MALCLYDVVKGNDVGMGHPLEDVYFSRQELAQIIIVNFVFVDDLYGNLGNTEV